MGASSAFLGAEEAVSESGLWLGGGALVGTEGTGLCVDGVLFCVEGSVFCADDGLLCAEGSVFCADEVLFCAEGAAEDDAVVEGRGMGWRRDHRGAGGLRGAGVVVVGGAA